MSTTASFLPLITLTVLVMKVYIVYTLAPWSPKVIGKQCSNYTRHFTKGNIPLHIETEKLSFLWLTWVSELNFFSVDKTRKYTHGFVTSYLRENELITSWGEAGQSRATLEFSYNVLQWWVGEGQKLKIMFDNFSRHFLQFGKKIFFRFDQFFSIPHIIWKGGWVGRV